MTDFLTNGPLTVDEIMDAIRTQSRDESDNPVFSDENIKLAIRQAILNSSGTFFTTATTTLAFVAGTFEYTIADDIQRIVLITRDRTGWQAGTNTLSSTSVSSDIRAYRHFNFGKGSNKLHFLKDYPTSTMDIYYQRDIPVPIENRVLGALISSTSATSATLTSADPQLWHLALPAYAKIDNEIIKITAISGNTTLTIARGQLGTTAATHSNGAEVKFIVLADTQRFYNYLFAEVGRLLNQWRVQAGSGNIDVAANLTASRLFKDDKDEIVIRRPQTKKTRRLRFVPGRRQRRGL